MDNTINVTKSAEVPRVKSSRISVIDQKFVGLERIRDLLTAHLAAADRETKIRKEQMAEIISKFSKEILNLESKELQSTRPDYFDEIKALRNDVKEIKTVPDRSGLSEEMAAIRKDIAEVKQFLRERPQKDEQVSPTLPNVVRTNTVRNSTAIAADRLKGQYTKYVVKPNLISTHIKTSDQTKEALIKAINLASRQYRVEKLIRYKERSVEIQITGIDQTIFAQESATAEAGLVVEIRSKKKQRLIITSVNKETTKDQLLAALTRQSDIDGICLSNCAEVFRNSAKNQNSVHVIIEVSSEIREKLLKQRRIYVGVRSYKCYDYIRPTRCFNCQRFGHTATGRNGKCRNDPVPTQRASARI